MLALCFAHMVSQLPLLIGPLVVMLLANQHLISVVLDFYNYHLNSRNLSYDTLLLLGDQIV